MVIAGTVPGMILIPPSTLVAIDGSTPWNRSLITPHE
jgi:hypothetical protein